MPAVSRRRRCGGRGRGRGARRGRAPRGPARPPRGRGHGAEVVDRVAVAHADDVLVDDRAVVELRGRVVRGDADDLHARVRGPGGRAPAHERGQERVVDVDDAVGPLVDEVGAQDLHVAGEHHERHAVRLEHREHRAFLLRLGVRRDRQVEELDPEPLAHLGVVGVVGDHHRHVDRQLAPTASEPAGRRGSAPPSTPARRRAGRRRRSAPRTACRSVRRSAGTRARSRRARGRSRRARTRRAGRTRRRCGRCAAGRRRCCRRGGRRSRRWPRRHRAGRGTTAAGPRSVADTPFTATRSA